MKRVLTAVVLIPLVLVAVFKAPLWLFATIVAAIALFTLHEYLNIVETAGIKPFRWLTYAVGIAPFALFGYSLWATAPALREYHAYPVNVALLRYWIPVFGLAALIFGIPLVFRKDLKGGLSSVAASIFGTIYIPLSLSCLVSLRSSPGQQTLILFVLLSVWSGDIAAYYFGRAFGRHKLAPIVSPNKSWEGAVASVMASVAVAIAVVHWNDELAKHFADSSSSVHDLYLWSFSSHGRVWLGFSSTIFHAILLGVLTNVAAQFGDLFESALKRGAGVKDSGSILPGHGGFLDRIDALLFAIPVVWYYATLTNFLGPY
jgi:phosphatidate cytidylyltransferase